MLNKNNKDISIDNSKSFIHRHYLLLKAHYFFSHASLASFIPILVMILDSRGLSKFEILYINLVIPFLIFFINPIVGYVADHTRRFRFTFNITFGLATIVFLIMFFSPSIKTHHIQGQIHRNETNEYSMIFCANEHFITKCTLRNKCGCIYQATCTQLETTPHFNKRSVNNIFHLNFTMNREDVQEEEEEDKNLAIFDRKHSQCHINYRLSINKEIDQIKDPFRNVTSKKNLKLANCQIKCSEEHICDGSRYANQLFRVLLYSLLVVLARTLFHTAITIGTAIGFATINRSNLFGRQRVWGTIAFGLTAFGTSRLYAHLKTDYIYIVVLIVTSIASILITCFIHVPSDQSDESKAEDKEMSEVRENLNDFSDNENKENTRKNKKKRNTHGLNMTTLLSLLKKIDVIIFLFTTFLWGISFAALDPYLLMYIDEISPCQAHSIAGYLSFIAAGVEILALVFSHKIIKHIGMKITTIIIFLSFSIRFFGYYFISRPYFYLPLETIHFFTFGILFVLISEEAFRIAPFGLGGTLQGLVNGISFGLGHGIGLLICLLLLRRLKEGNIFLHYGIFNVLGCFIYVIYCLFSKRSSSSLNQSKDKIKNVSKEVKSEAEKNLNEEFVL